MDSMSTDDSLCMSLYESMSPYGFHEDRRVPMEHICFIRMHVGPIFVLDSVHRPVSLTMLAPSKPSSTATERGVKAGATRAANKLRKEQAAGSAAMDGLRGMFKASVKVEKADAVELTDDEQDEEGTHSGHEEVPAGQPAPLSCVSTVPGMHTPEPRFCAGASPTPSPPAEPMGPETPRHDGKDAPSFPNGSLEGARAELNAMGLLGDGDVEKFGLAARSVIDLTTDLFKNGGCEQMTGFMANDVAQSARVGEAAVVGDDQGGDMEVILMTEKETIFQQASE